MQAKRPEGPLRRDDRDEPAWLEEPSSERDASHDQHRRRRAAFPTLLLVAAVALIVVLILLL